MYHFWISLYLVFDCILYTYGCWIDFLNIGPHLTASSVKRTKIFPLDPDQVTVDVFQPIRIKYFRLKTNYTHEQDISFSPSETATEREWLQVEDLLDWVLNEIQKIVIGVRPVKTPILIDPVCLDENGTATGRHTYCAKSETCTYTCKGVPLPLNIRNGCFSKDDNTTIHSPEEGVNDVDLVLYVTMADCPSGFLAFGAPCGFDDEIGAPLVGLVSVCYNEFFEKELDDSWRDVMLHELLHVFLDDLKGTSYRTESGQKRNNTFTVKRKKWMWENESYTEYDFTASLLPFVVRFAQNHFNCPSLEFLELFEEDSGHVNKRLFPDALMSPARDPGMYISKLDTAFLKETGWYRINETYDGIVDLKATRNKGCEFVTQSCFKYMQSVDYDPIGMYPYCLEEESESVKSFCSPDHQKIVSCDTSQSSEVYYKNCPLAITHKRSISSVCFLQDRINDYRNKMCIEYKLFGSDSEVNNTDPIRSFAKCTSFVCKNDSIEIMIEEDDYKTAYNCKDSGRIRFSGYIVEIICPSFEYFCAADDNSTPTVVLATVNATSEISTLTTLSFTPLEVLSSNITVVQVSLTTTHITQKQQTLLQQPLTSTVDISSSVMNTIKNDTSTINEFNVSIMGSFSSIDTKQEVILSTAAEKQEVSVEKPFSTVVDVVTHITNSAGEETSKTVDEIKVCTGKSTKIAASILTGQGSSSKKPTVSASVKKFTTSTATKILLSSSIGKDVKRKRSPKTKRSKILTSSKVKILSTTAKKHTASSKDPEEPVFPPSAGNSLALHYFKYVLLTVAINLAACFIF